MDESLSARLRQYERVASSVVVVVVVCVQSNTKGGGVRKEKGTVIVVIVVVIVKEEERTTDGIDAKDMVGFSIRCRWIVMETMVSSCQAKQKAAWVGGIRVGHDVTLCDVMRDNLAVMSKEGKRHRSTTPDEAHQVVPNQVHHVVQHTHTQRERERETEKGLIHCILSHCLLAHLLGALTRESALTTTIFCVSVRLFVWFVVVVVVLDVFALSDCFRWIL